MERKNNKQRKEINGSKYKLAIVAAEFNSDITGAMLAGAKKTLIDSKVKDANIKIVRVSGAFEIPLACQKLAKQKKYHGIIVLGCVIKGETDHYYYIAGEASRGVMDVMLKYDLPIGFGIITTNNLKQAQSRSSGKNNKGAEAAFAVLEMLVNDIFNF